MPARRKVQSAADPRHPLAKHGNVVGRRGHGLAGEMASIAGDARQPPFFVAQRRRDDVHPAAAMDPGDAVGPDRSEEHTSELQSLMRISYAVFCLKKKKHKTSQ